MERLGKRIFIENVHVGVLTRLHPAGERLGEERSVLFEFRRFALKKNREIS